MAVTDDGYIEKSQFGSYPGKVKRFPFPHRLTENSQEIAKNILKDIEVYLSEHAAEVAAILFEPIQGAAGFIIPPKNFLNDLVKIAKAYNVITICDEIQTGIYRTGSFYYINQIGIDPDVILIGKSLAGGYYPLSAVIANRELYMSVDSDRSGFDSTFSTNLFGIEIANNVVSYIEEKDIATRVNETGKYFFSRLKKLLVNYDYIKELDGIGMAYGFRIESASKRIKEDAALAKKIKRKAFANHLIIQTAGPNGNNIKLSPSFLISKDEIEEAILKLRVALETIK